MLKLYGFSVSNYYNVVKAAMLEKGMDFEEVPAYTPLKGDILTISPMGKVPCLETAQGALTESQVMLDYLEDVQPQPALYPADAFARAKVRELLKVIELYLELPARRLYPEVFFGGKVSDEVKAEVRPALEKGVKALLQLASFKPYIAGESFGYADIAATIHFPLVRDVGKRIYDTDLLAPLPDVDAYMKLVRGRPSMQRVLADYKQGLDAFFNKFK